MVERLFLAVPQGCLRFVIVVFPDHSPLLFLQGQEEIVQFTKRNQPDESLKERLWSA